MTPNLRIIYDEELGEGCYVQPHQAALVYDKTEGLTLHLPNCNRNDEVPLEVQYLVAMLAAAKDTNFVESIVESFLDSPGPILGQVH